MEEPEQESIITVFGTFKDNELIEEETNQIIDCLTYGITRPIIQGKKGFYNLRRTGLAWIIIQYLLIDD